VFLKYPKRDWWGVWGWGGDRGGGFGGSLGESEIVVGVKKSKLRLAKLE